MADYQRIETRESSSGAKLLSSYPRSLSPIDSGILALPNGLSEQDIQLAPAVVPPVGIHWAMNPNLRYKVSASVSVQVGNEGNVSLESAGMFAIVGQGAGSATIANAARLSSTTALAQRQIISFDEWALDCNDMISLLQQNGGLGNFFVLLIRLVFNQVAGGPAQLQITGSYKTSAAQFNSYIFDKWE